MNSIGAHQYADPLDIGNARWLEERS